MFEENKASEEAVSPRQIPDLPSALNLLDEAEKERDRLASVVEFTNAQLKSWAEKWSRAAMLFEASLEEDGVDIDDLNENTNALVQMFGIEFTKEVEVRVTVTYSGTVTIPKNADVYDVQSGLDYYDSLDLELEGNTVGSISYDDFDIEEI